MRTVLWMFAAVVLALISFAPVASAATPPADLAAEAVAKESQDVRGVRGAAFRLRARAGNRLLGNGFAFRVRGLGANAFGANDLAFQAALARRAFVTNAFFVQPAFGYAQSGGIQAFAAGCGGVTPAAASEFNFQFRSNR